jgi:predicted RND superfamily exporter protein
LEHPTTSTQKIVSDLAEFDFESGSILERVLFNNRPVFLALCFIITCFLGLEACQIRLNASFDEMIPDQHPYIVNYQKHYNELQGQGNAIRIAVSADRGSILDSHYLGVLQNINDEAFLLPGVSRPFMTSLWTSNTRWTAVTPDGLEGGPVMPQSYDGSPEQLQIVKQNIENTGQIGSLVSPDFTSSMIYVPLMEINNLTGKPLDYGDLGRQLDELRTKYAAQGVTLHITGFAMVVGDLINGITKVLAFFLVSLIIASLMLYWYTRCLRATVLVVTASLVAVTWQMGMLPLLGYNLNPYSALVPFLIFAIGMSHGAQKMNGVMQDIGRGMHPLVAARYTFRRLFLAGFAALVCDAVSFAVLLTIRITAIHDLAVIASLGVFFLIFTNLIMLPMMLSYTGISRKAALRSLRSEEINENDLSGNPFWRILSLSTSKKYASLVILMAVGLGIYGWSVGRNVKIGDLNQGAPELRADSQYNMDNSYINSHYSTGNDTLVVLADMPEYQCTAYRNVAILDALEWRLRQLPEVQSTISVGSESRIMAMMTTEDSPKWDDISSNQDSLNSDFGDLPANLSNNDCSFAPVYVSLTDHKATTLNAVIGVINKFVANPAYQNAGLKITLAGGNAGIEAATNAVIGAANNEMLYLVYAAVITFCFISFRSWRAVLCAVLPLILTTILSQALMVWLGIGVKVATLPVIALGVGIGVDYALYVLSIILKHVRAGEDLSIAYQRTLAFTGKVVILTGFTLSAGVATWIFAPIKFQADMGVLLSFMFLWNMLGALILLPALATFLLPGSLVKQMEDELMASKRAATAASAQPVPHRIERVAAQVLSE